MSRLLFRWTDDALIVANTGRCFTRAGLDALCSSHLSDKLNSIHEGFASETEAKDAVTEIRERELAVYGRSPSRVIQDARLEVETGRDYSGRLLLELMQNADDAAAQERIGYKGLGFKSVLDVAESARIHSGPLRICFDRARSRSALAGFAEASEVPVLRLPFWDDRNASSHPALNQALDQYDTVIVLPWKNSQVLTLFAHEWKTVSEDPSMLLLHALEEVGWQDRNDSRVTWLCKRSGDIELSVMISGRDAKRSKWRVFREPVSGCQTAAVVALDDGGKLRPSPHSKLRVFFPTDEECPLPMILHGAFDLTQNRKRVRQGGNRLDVVQSVALCVKRALMEVTDDGRFLDLLRPRIPPENMTDGLEREIWNAVSAVVSEMILPVCKVRLSSVRLCPMAYSDGFPWYSQRLDKWRIFKELLAAHRPDGLAGLNLLLPGTDTDQREQVICAFKSGAHLSVAELRRLPLFPIASGETPVAASGIRLFLPPEHMPAPLSIPSVRLAFLQEEFASGCKKHAPVQELLKALGIREFVPPHIAAALAESPLDAVPREPLWEFLLSTVAPMLKEADSVMDCKDNHRRSLAEKVQVPCQKQQWASAGDVYAGQEWTGNDFLERAYSLRPNRYFLAEPPADQSRRAHLERLARWLGVGWSPKVLPVRDQNGKPLNFADKAGTKEGVRWDRDVFPISDRPELWGGHCAELNNDRENGSRSARLRQDWTIDGDADVLRAPGAFPSINSEWESYEKYREAILYRSSNYRQDHDNQRKYGPSYLAHLFREIAWIPTNSGGLIAAHDVFAPEGEVFRELTGWVHCPAESIDADLAKKIGIRRDWSEINEADWDRWLVRSMKLDPQADPEHQTLITQLYRQALRRFDVHHQNTGQRFRHGEIWCLEKRQDNTTIWHRQNGRNDVFYVDRPDLAKLRLELFKTFPVELAQLEDKAQRLFGVSCLSGHLHGEAKFDEDVDGEVVHGLTERLTNRAACLLAYLKVRRLDPSQARHDLENVDYRVGKGLRVRFTLNGNTSSALPVPTYFECSEHSMRAVLWLDADENFTGSGQPRDIAWEEVGLALCYSARLQLEHGTVFAGLLSCGEDSLKRKLLNLGVTESEVAAALPRISIKGVPDEKQPVKPTHMEEPSGVPAAEEEPTKQGAQGEAARERPANGRPGTGQGGHGSGGGGGESELHRAIKERLVANPDLIEAGMHSARKEYEFKSGDRADLVCEDSDDVPVAVEVESHIAPGNMVGLWQAVKYKHLLAVERERNCAQVRAFLVAPAIPEDVKVESLKFGIVPREISID